MKKLISHYDDLQRAIKVLETLEQGESIKKGFEMLVKNFQKLLDEEGVKPMNCQGQKFDPYKHEVKMVKIDNNLPENTIIEELSKGYYYNNEVLRPAMVIISKKSEIET